MPPYLLEQDRIDVANGLARGAGVMAIIAQQHLDVSSIRLNEGADIGLFEPEATERLRITPFLHQALRAWLRAPLAW